uniref:Chloride channel protein n=1 Tax=Callorhinchus milii TaxID=7868 RepID=A0A4W3J3B5_CALMI
MSGMRRQQDRLGAEDSNLLQDNVWRPGIKTRRRMNGMRLSRVGDDWYFLFIFGILMALISFGMDFTVSKLLKAHRHLYEKLDGSSVLQYLCWTIYPIALTTFSTGFSQSISSQSGGSGIPELKTILTGVLLEEYLMIKNFSAKVVGMTCTLAAGSTLFLGKVGPFVHVSSIIATYLGRIRTTVTGDYEVRETWSDQGVEGGNFFFTAVKIIFRDKDDNYLFVEVMSSHFAIRNYWRGFFAATCGAFMFRLLAVFNSEQETITALFKTKFRVDFPFDLPETMIFIALGILCGTLSCFYLSCQRWVLGYTKRNLVIVKLMATKKAVYSGLVALLMASITFPSSLGQFMPSRLTMKELLSSLFDHRPWNVLSQNLSLSNRTEVDPDNLWIEWCHPTFTIFGTLLFFLVMKFWMMILVTTMPMPAGYFMPVLIYGAAIGRLVGEVVAYIFPNGIRSEGVLNPIIPGGYALAGAAAFSGAVTHTLSTALLVFELTGQMAHFLPVLLAVLVANAIAQKFQPSFYDGTIIVKKLPYLPKIRSSNTGSYSVTVEEFMNTSLVCLAKVSSYTDILQVINSSSHSLYPVVESVVSNTRIIIIIITNKERPFAEMKHLFCLMQEKVDENLWGKCHIDPVTFQLSPSTLLHQVDHRDHC